MHLRIQDASGFLCVTSTMRWIRWSVGLVFAQVVFQEAGPSEALGQGHASVT